MPRGFLGAQGTLSEVELVLVFAEPGDPQPGERHSGMNSALLAAHYYYQSMHDQFHRNVRYILNLCWPQLRFDEQLRKVWLTESVLCSAPVESGHVRRQIELTCAERYLRQQLNLFPHALVAALGNKAQRRLRAIGHTRFLAAYAVAPPGSNHPQAKSSWEKIPIELAKYRSQSRPSKAPEQVTRTLTNTANQPQRQLPQREKILTGLYEVVDTTRLQATEETDPGKWSIWRHIWQCRSFEELAKACPEAAYTRTNRRITWRTEATWALKRGWIKKLG